MGYKIIYGDEPRHPCGIKWGSVRLRSLIAICLLVFSLSVRLLWHDGAEILCQLLLPGEQAIAEQAFLELVSDLRAGDGAKEALTVFCRTILNETY